MKDPPSGFLCGHNGPIYHPFLFAVFPVVSLLAHNINEIWSYREPLMLTGLSLLSAFVLLALLFLLLRDWDRTALVVSLLLVLFHSYGHFIRLIWSVNFSILGLSVGRNLMLFPLWVIAFIVGVCFAGSKHKQVGKITQMLNIVALVLVVLPVTKVVARGVQRSRDLAIGEANSVWFPESHSFKGPPRDVYYIVLDRYASEKTLRDVYGHDNSGFLSFLRDRGFYVANDSYANYPRTVLSLASSLNMRYLGFLEDSLGRECEDFVPAGRMILDNLVGRYFKFYGYRHVHLGSSWYFTRRNENADVNFHGMMLPEFTRALYRTTMLFPVGEKFNLLGQASARPTFIVNKFEELTKLPGKRGPQFVFAHFLLPHHPYVFDRHGNTLPSSPNPTMVESGAKQKYVDQLIFANTMTMQMIDSLLVRSPVKPIVLVQSDEGPYPEGTDPQKGHFPSWKSASLTQHMQKSGILNALLLPGVDSTLLYPSLSPVNGFRLVFSQYFGADLPLLPDRIYAIERDDYPYSFFEITQEMEGMLVSDRF